MSFSSILDRVRQYHIDMLETHGATPRGVDWNSREAQELSFDQLLKVCARTTDFSINDYGCGYGALVQYLADRGYVCHYRGFDICEALIAIARELYQGFDHCEFFMDESLLTVADYTVASGIFNQKVQTSDEEWQEYILATLGKIDEISARGFAFNALTKYSDPERMRPDLYYADPCFLFDYCKTRFSRNVALLHDYGAYHFTIIVRK